MKKSEVKQSEVEWSLKVKQTTVQWSEAIGNEGVLVQNAVTY